MRILFFILLLASCTERVPPQVRKFSLQSDGPINKAIHSSVNNLVIFGSGSTFRLISSGSVSLNLGTSLGPYKIPSYRSMLLDSAIFAQLSNDSILVEMLAEIYLYLGGLPIIFSYQKPEEYFIQQIADLFNKKYGTKGPSDVGHCQGWVIKDKELRKKLWSVLIYQDPTSIEFIISNSICQPDHGPHYHYWAEINLIKMISERIYDPPARVAIYNNFKNMPRWDSSKFRN